MSKTAKHIRGAAICIGIISGIGVARGTPCGGSGGPPMQVPLITWAGGTTTPTCGSFFESYDGVLRFIDINFNTLPDGTPSHPGPIYITPTFNYTARGATFSAPVSYPFIGGNDQSGYALQVNSGNISVHDWIIADLTTPQAGVGIYSGGGTTLYAYDAQGGLIASVSYTYSGTFFLGIRSDTPIARAIINRGSYTEAIGDFFIVRQVPEPASLAMVGAGLFMFSRRGLRQRSS